MFNVYLVNFKTTSPEFETFGQAVAWARNKNFEAAIHDLSQEINWGTRIVGYYSPLSGLKDLRDCFPAIGEYTDVPKRA